VKSDKSIPSLADLEALVPAGKLNLAVKALQRLNLSQIPRKDLSRYANIANRVGQFRIAYRILSRVVRQQTEGAETANSSEWLEYAEALRRMGLIAEAQRILEKLDATGLPVVHLRRAYCLVNQWRYGEAIPHLQTYLSAVDPKEYAHLVASVNLAAALAYERKDQEALDLLDRLISETKSTERHLLFINCLELKAQVSIHQGQLDRADRALEEAVSVNSDPRTRYSLFLRKWQAISKSLRLGAVHPDLLECRRSAMEEEDWETLRECDLYTGFVSSDLNLLGKVYFGTPFPAYRQRILDIAGAKFTPGRSFLWSPSGDKSTNMIFDVLHGKMDGSDTMELEKGQLKHRMMALLAADFYRPLSIGTAFSELFPDEQFSQVGSTNRVCHVIRRLRQWMAEGGHPFAIEENQGSYRLTAAPGIALRVSAEAEQGSSEEMKWEEARRLLPSGSFSRGDVIRTLGCSVSTAKRRLRWAIDSGKVEVLGDGPRRRYRLS
jgi:tetratricopeptide (TPR) repeat protein